VIKSKLYDIIISHQAKKDISKFNQKQKIKLKEILMFVISKNPYEGKKLLGDLAGCYSYRLTLKDRVLYRIDEKTKTVYILRARTHYGN